MIDPKHLESFESLREYINAELIEAISKALEEEDRKFDEWLLYGDRGKDG